MKAKNDIKPISYIKANAAEILNQVNETRSPVYITQNGVARGVVIDPETYDNLNDTLMLLKIISLGEKDIRDGNMEDSDIVFKRIEKKFFSQNEK